MKIEISRDSSGYGTCNDEQIKIVQRRMEIICREMGYEFEYVAGNDCVPSQTDGDDELVFELAMGCRSVVPADYAAAVNAANTECPL